MAILLLLICVLALILLYGVASSFLFFLAIANTILYLVTALAIPNIIAISAMKRYKAKVEKAHRQGASDEEMEIVLNDEVDITEKDKQAAPIWLYVINLVSIVLAIILCITGAIYRISL